MNPMGGMGGHAEAPVSNNLQAHRYGLMHGSGGPIFTLGILVQE